MSNYMNHQFATDLREPIQYGIGIHGGEVIVGDIGFRDHTVFTALGDPVNVAARLQDMTKNLDCKAIVSDEVCNTAGVAADPLARTEVAIRGREEPMMVRTAADPTVLASLLESRCASRRAAVGRSRSPGVIGPGRLGPGMEHLCGDCGHGPGSGEGGLCVAKACCFGRDRRGAWVRGVLDRHHSGNRPGERAAGLQPQHGQRPGHVPRRRLRLVPRDAATGGQDAARRRARAEIAVRHVLRSQYLVRSEGRHRRLERGRIRHRHDQGHVARRPALLSGVSLHLVSAHARGGRA